MAERRRWVPPRLSNPSGVEDRRYVMQNTKALTLGLMLAAAAALLPQNASARPWGWHGGGWHGGGWHGGWHRGVGWGWGAAALGTGLALGAIASAPYYGDGGYYAYPAYPYGYYPDYAYGYGDPGYYGYGYAAYPRCYYQGYVRVCRSRTIGQAPL